MDSAEPSSLDQERTIQHDIPDNTQPNTSVIENPEADIEAENKRFRAWSLREDVPHAQALPQQVTASTSLGETNSRPYRNWILRSDIPFKSPLPEPHVTIELAEWDSLRQTYTVTEEISQSKDGDVDVRQPASKAIGNLGENEEMHESFQVAVPGPLLRKPKTPSDVKRNMTPIPFALYPRITRYIRAKIDLISLSLVSPRWRVEAEAILWRAVELFYDDTDIDNIRKVEFLIRRGAGYVRHLDIDYAYGENAHRNDTIENSESFLKAVQAISRMNHLEELEIYCSGGMAALLLSPATSEIPSGGTLSELKVPAFPSFQTIRTIKYLGACSPTLYRFLRSCTNLQSLRFSNNLEPTADYSLLYHHDPSESLGVWKALTTFSGNILHVAAILRSPTVSTLLKNMTIHLQPAVVTIEQGFAGVSPALGVEVLGIGDSSGYKPFALDHVLKDLADALTFFPNVKEIRRAPFYDRVNRQQLLKTLSVVPRLTYLSLLDYEPFVPTRGLNLAKELMERTACDDLRTVVCIPCPNGPTAVMFRRQDAKNRSKEQSPRSPAGRSDGNDTSSRFDLPSPLPSSSTVNHDGWLEEWIDLDDDTEV